MTYMFSRYILLASENNSIQFNLYWQSRQTMCLAINIKYITYGKNMTYIHTCIQHTCTRARRDSYRIKVEIDISRFFIASLVYLDILTRTFLDLLFNKCANLFQLGHGCGIYVVLIS
jgi:hypothetical protein